MNNFVTKIRNLRIISINQLKDTTMKKAKIDVRPMSEIIKDIRKDWGAKMYFGAVPYFKAMESLTSVNGSYGADSGKSIILYFLSNASTWKGETARKVKLELNQMCK
jgi:hypothetical protein